MMEILITPNKQGLPRRTIRMTARVPITRFADEYAYNHHCTLHMDQIDESATMQKALQSDYSKEQKEAADDEYKSLMEHRTWKLMQPLGKG